MLRFGAVRILFDYRAALRRRTGVGEYAHELAAALARQSAVHQDTLTLLTASWKDRVAPTVGSELPLARVVDRRIPVWLLTAAWNRFSFPPAEWLAGPADIVHSQTPLLIPARRAAQVVTVHDLFFLSRPESTEAEIRRDYVSMARAHAQRADHIIVSSRHAAGEVAGRLGVEADRVTVCSPGAPPWAREVRAVRERRGPGTTLLFLGTLEPRKNVPGLLAAYAALRRRRPDAPALILAGDVRPSVQADLRVIDQPPLRGHVTVRGYVDDGARMALYADARVLILPSLDEGFGLPVLEAMACGVPVAVSNRGSLPEVVGDAARPVAPDDHEGLADELARLLDDAAHGEAVARGLARATEFSWSACAAAARGAYDSAIERRRGRRR